MFVAAAGPAQAVLDSLREKEAAHASAGTSPDAPERRDNLIALALLTQLMGPAAAPPASQ